MQNQPRQQAPTTHKGVYTMYDIKAIKDNINLEQYCKNNLTPHGKAFICPSCKSGTGKNATPAFSINSKDHTKWKCFACEKSGDIIDLIGITENLDTKQSIQRAGELIGVISTPKSNLTNQSNKIEQVHPKANNKPLKSNITNQNNNQKIESYILEAKKNITDPQAINYLAKRGINQEEAEFFNLGFDVKYKRLIIPFEDMNYYTARSTNGHEPKYSKPKGIIQPIENQSVLDQNYFIIVEGQLDAIAGRIAGLNTLALAGIGNTALKAELERVKYSGIIFLALDNDKAGEQAELNIIEHLNNFTVEKLDHPAKDLGELLTDRPKLAQWANQTKDIIQKTLKNHEVKTLQELGIKKTSNLVTQITQNKAKNRFYSTGFKRFDEILGGGLQGGSVHILGAGSSLGKTTFMLQIADFIASCKQPVLFVSIEQSAIELVAKSLSRLASTSEIITAKDIRQTRLEDHNESKQWAITKARDNYLMQIEPNMFFLSPNNQPKITDIKKSFKLIKQLKEREPVVFIDYLQLLAPEEESFDTRNATDKNITSLRQWARDEQAALFLISSLNRDSYTSAITLGSFKESGGIEYGADVLIGLQPRGLQELSEDIGLQASNAKFKIHCKIADCKDDIPRHIELITLKNRHGEVPKNGIYYTLDPRISNFKECYKQEPPKLHSTEVKEFDDYIETTKAQRL